MGYKKINNIGSICTELNQDMREIKICVRD